METGDLTENYEKVTGPIRIMNEPAGMDIGARRITVSTCGIIPGIARLKGMEPQINLSISIHAANNKLRDKLMPINKLYPLEKLIKTCADYMNKTKRIITFEYVVIKRVNDSSRDADELAAVARRLKAKVNLIPYSAIPDSGFQPPQDREIKIFMEWLVRKGAKVT